MTTDVLTYPFNTSDNLDLDARYAELRSQPDLARVQLRFGETAWLATRYEDVRTVLGDPRFSRKEAAAHDEPRNREGRVTTGILSMDPPDHTRLRKLVSRAFTRRRVEDLRPKVADLARSLLTTELAAGDSFDLVDRFALPIPVQVICELLGVPTGDRDKFRAWSDAALSTTTLTADEFDASREEFREYMHRLIGAKRAEPADDLMSALIAARDEDDKLSEIELIDLCNAILVAGHETTATQIPNFVLYLLGQPGTWTALHENPRLVPNAVEELMRLVPLGIGGGQARYALEDVQLGETVVRAGEAVLVALAAANRDPQAYSDPESFDLERGTTTGHLGFGHGAHFCLGASLARLELQEAMAAATAMLPDIEIRDVTWKTGMAVRGPSRLIVSNGLSGADSR